MKKHCKLLALGLIVLGAVALVPVAQPVAAKGISGWHCNDYGEWTYINACFYDVKGWQQIDSSWYYFRGDGVMETGWRYIQGNWYFLADSGAMQTGWVKDGGNWYYLTSNGSMATGWQHINNQWYYFYSSGVMAHSCGIDHYYINSSGFWDD